MMEKLKNNKIFMYILSALLIVSGVFLITGQKPVDEATAVSEEVPFYSDPGDNLFMVEGYGDLVVSVIRKDDGSGYGPLGFCLAKLKFFPGTDDILYSNVLDKSQYTWDLGDGRNVTSDQAAMVDRAIYAFNFVYNDKLANYGLASDDTMSLYHAAQIAIWSIAEGWTTDMVVKDPETAADADLNALADKIHALYTDIYNYAVNNSNATFESGTVLLNVTSDSAVTNGTDFNLSGTTQYRAADSTLYYRTPLLSLISKQDAGVVWSGDYAYRYKVELVNAPEGARVVNENGAPQTEFSTEAGVGSDFYVEVPVVTETGGSFTVNVTTTEFRRLDTVLWHPITATGYQSLMQVGAIPDSGSASFKVTYSAIATGQIARIQIYKEAEQLEGFEVYESIYGTTYILNYETLPLKGAQYQLYMGELQQIYTNMTDGQVYASRGQMFRNAITTDADGYALYDGLPLSLDTDHTEYIVKEVAAPYGYTLKETAAENEKVVEVHSNPYLYIPTFRVSFTNEPVKFTMKPVVKMLENEEGKIVTTSSVPFGVYTNEEIPTVNDGNIPKDALVGIIYTDSEGKLTSDGLTIPAGYTYYIKEIEAPADYNLDTNKYYLDTTIPANLTTNTFEVVLKNAQGVEVTEIVNQMKKYSLKIQKEVQFIPENLNISIKEDFSYKPITSGNGYKFGIYSDYECNNLLEEVTENDYSDGVFTSKEYYKDELLCVKELAAPEGYEISDEVKCFYAGEGNAATFQNNLKTGSITVNKYDITGHKDDPENGVLQSGVKFYIQYSGITVDEKTTENGTLTFENLPLNTCYMVKEVVPAGYISETESQEVCLNTLNKTVRVNNYAAEIKANIQIAKYDRMTGEPLSGVEFSLFESSDTTFSNPIAVDVTDDMGTLTFKDVANKEYIIKETRQKDGYIISAEGYTMDLREVNPGETKHLTVLNDRYYGKVRLTKTDLDNSSLYIKGAIYGLYDAETDNLIEEKETDSNGQIIFMEQEYGKKLYVQEIQAPQGYKLSSEKVNITIDDTTKTYYDVNVKDEKAKASLTIVKTDSVDENIKLANAEFKIYFSDDANLTNPIATVTTNSNGMAVVNGLELKQYVVVETNAPNGYEKYTDGISVDLTGYDDGATLELKVPNTKLPPEPTYISFTVSKVWSGDEGYDVRPSSVSVQLMNGTDVVGLPVILDESNGWSYTWTGLVEGNDWNVSEVNVPEGYTSIIGTPSNNTVTITNVYTPKLSSKLTVNKVWSGDDEADRPTFISLQLMNGDTPVGKPVSLTSANNWTYSWSELDGSGDWSVAEIDSPTDYSTIMSEKTNDKITITNLYTKEQTTQLTVNKIWSGDEGYDVRPESIEVQLMNGTTAVGEPVVLSATTNWTYTWTDLDIDGDWTVKEVELPERYECVVSENVNNTVTITNIYTPIPTIDLTVEKIWSGDEGYNVRPATISVQLMNGTSNVGSPVRLSEANNWTYTWTGLIDGENWTVAEVSVPERYESSISPITNNKITITNTYTPIPTFNLEVEKNWVGDENNLSDRPTFVDVQLTLNGSDYGNPVRLNVENSWHYTFEGLEVGKEWAVKELDISERYESNIKYEDEKFIITNTYIPIPTTELTVIKEWVGDEGYNIRPESIDVQLMNGTTAVGEPVVLSATTNWTYTWTDLDIDGDWTVKEVELPERYACEVSENVNNTVTITNTYTPIPTFDLTVKKVWIDDDGFGVRPMSVEVQLVDGTTPVGDAVALGETNGWTYTWEGLEEGRPWTVKEVLVPAGYTSTVSNLDNNTITVTNTFHYIPEPTTELTVIKEWVGDENYNVRPEYIEVQLMNGTTPVGQLVRLTEEGNWTYTWRELDMDGTWTVAEVNVPERYESAISENVNNTVTITNTYTPEPTTTLTIEKVWVGDEGYDVRPERIEVQLMNGANIDGTPVVLSATNNWTYTWSGLDIDGDWTVKEVDVPEGYESNVSETTNNKVTITNTYTPTIDITVKKIWAGDEGYNVRPEYVEIQLMDGNTEVGSAIRLNESNNWSYTWSKLEDGRNWTVKEIDVPEGYTSVIGQLTNGLIKVTNTYTPAPIPTFDLTVNKVWKGDAAYNSRPEYIEIQLLKGDEEIGTPVKLSEENRWNYVFEDLEEGYAWNVTEKNVPSGYTATISRSENTVTITNEYTYIPEPTPTTELTVEKVWAGDEGYDVRPEYIEVKLVEGVTPVGQAIKLSEENDWTYAWTELDATKEWSVIELNVPAGYTANISTVENKKITITNTYTYIPEPEPTFDLTVVKEWVNDAGKHVRPESVTIQLMKNAKPEGLAIVLNADNNWTYTWEDLSEDYSWAVTEVNIPRGYTARISAINNGKITVTNTYTDPKDPEIIPPINPNPTPKPTPSITERPDSGVMGNDITLPLMGTGCLAAGLLSLLAILKKKK